MEVKDARVMVIPPNEYDAGKSQLQVTVHDAEDDNSDANDAGQRKFWKSMNGERVSKVHHVEFCIVCKKYTGCTRAHEHTSTAKFSLVQTKTLAEVLEFRDGHLCQSPPSEVVSLSLRPSEIRECYCVTLAMALTVAEATTVSKAICCLKCNPTLDVSLRLLDATFVTIFQVTTTTV